MPTLARRIFLLTAAILLTIQATNPARAEDLSSEQQIMKLFNAIPPYSPKATPKATVKVFGSSSMDALANGWKKGFAKFQPDVELLIHGTNSEEAFAQLVQSPSSIAMLSRPVKAEELENLKSKGLKQPVAFVVAREALAVFVNKANPIETVTGSQLKNVFTQATPADQLTWGLMGANAAWKDKPIRLVSRTTKCGTQKFLKEFVFGSAELRAGETTHVSNSMVLGEVGKKTDAIAICGMRSVGSNVKMLQLVAGGKAIPSDDHAVLSGHYPLTRPLTLVIDIAQGDAQAIASREFVRYALGHAGQTQTVMDGFFPVELPLMEAGIAKLDSAVLR